jgi:tetratricopeptide (TPR) repeat protein
MQEAAVAADIRCLLRLAHKYLGRSWIRGRKSVCAVLLVPVLVIGLLWILGGTLPAVAAGLSAAQKDACLSASGSAAEAACRDALEQEPRDADIRAALSRALIQSRHFDQAIGILRDGLELEPGNADLKAQLARVEQLQDEQRWIEKQNQKREQSSATGMTSRQRAEVGLMQIRCTKLKGRTALEACNQGLALSPGNLALNIGKADALIGLERYGEALDSYQDAQTLDPSNTDIGRAMAKARALRQVSVKKCLQLSGSTALAACSAALQKGGADEAEIRERQGDLLAAAGKKQEAVSSYRAALAAGGGNSSIAAKLEVLSPTGSDSRQSLAPTPPAKIAAGPSPPPVPKPLNAPAPLRKPPQHAPAVAHVPSTAAPKPKPLPEVVAAAEAEKQKIPARLPGTAVAAPAPPAPTEKETGKYSNAALPSGFTH